MAWRAVCDCGWRGEGKRREGAEQDRRVHEWVHKTVDSAPPLSRETARKVAVLLGYRPWATVPDTKEGART